MLKIAEIGKSVEILRVLRDLGELNRLRYL
jgi:hypothetical protein